MLDIVDRYTVTIGGKYYNTVCVVDIMSEKDGIATEQYIDKALKMGIIIWTAFAKIFYGEIRNFKKMHSYLTFDQQKSGKTK